LEEILFIWSQENPKIRYYQGLTDIAEVFLITFLSSYFDLEIFRDELLVDTIAEQISADVYWCLTVFLRGMEVGT
jgi:hypothetical protein